MDTRNTEAVSAASATLPARPTAQAWVVLFMLFFVYVLNFLDRQLLSILAKPIQDSLHVTDGQLGLIGGLYFALFYCLISIPVGWIADKTNRSLVLAGACALWSASTMGCGLAANYLQLVVARMTVGVGEAGGVPPSYAIVSDYFPPGRRGTALGLYNMGPPIGAALGVAFGASIAAAYSWRMAFIVLGAAGLVTAVAVILVVREPRRGGLDHAHGHGHGHGTDGSLAHAASGFFSTFAMFFSRKSLVLMALASGATQMITYGAGNFTVLFLMRDKGMTLKEVALWYALVLAFAMGGGIFVSGRVIDRFAHRAKHSYATVPAVSLALALPFYLAFVAADTWQHALLFVLGPTFLNYFYLSSAVTMVQQEVKPDQRVMSGALLLLVMNLIGLGLGPTYVGAVSDFLRSLHYAHTLQGAFYALVPFYALAIFLFIWLARVLKQEAAGGMRP